MGNTVNQGVLRNGKTEVTLDIRNALPGVYFYEIFQKNRRQTGKVIILK